MSVRLSPVALQTASDNESGKIVPRCFQRLRGHTKNPLQATDQIELPRTGQNARGVRGFHAKCMNRSFQKIHNQLITKDIYSQTKMARALQSFLRSHKTTRTEQHNNERHP
jgi:hypothetical protein